jgi:phospholipid-binding lipoprotein MlaA
MLRKIFYTISVLLIFNISIANAGSTDSEKLKSNKSKNSTSECFEGASRAIFAFNHGLDNAIFKPVAKGYRSLPVPIRKGTGNVVSNLRSLLTLSNNILQGDLSGAGNAAGRFLLNSTIGVLGIWDPAEAAFGLKKRGKEDFGQTLGKWGSASGCYFVLPILGPTTARDAVGLVGNIFLDPIYTVTHNTETDFLIGNENYQEHNFYFYRGTDGVNFRAKNIESFESLEKNSIDLYASVKSIYLQDRIKKIENSNISLETQDDSDWEEIDTE